MFGVKLDWSLEVPDRYFTLESYEGGTARWCPSCGDHSVLSAVQKICRDKQIPPEKIASVSGIGCSSRFPHYMHAYGFHSLHGRALPVAWASSAPAGPARGWPPGGTAAIGAGHWLHAVRYNMDMTVMVFDNRIYGLTKAQTSPTSPIGLKTNTHPRGAWLPPLNILQNTLGFTNASFVARTVDWNPPHLYETLKAAHEHKGLSFVHILQRCPQYTTGVWQELQRNPDLMLLLTHEKGIQVDGAVARMYKNQLSHDPSNISEARELANPGDRMAIGLFYRIRAPRQFTAQGMEMSPDQRLEAISRTDHCHRRGISMAARRRTQGTVPSGQARTSLMGPSDVLAVAALPSGRIGRKESSSVAGMSPAVLRASAREMRVDYPLFLSLLSNEEPER
jgi:2-oxoglutarate ferredoxin oxidoreductase subunit beta